MKINKKQYNELFDGVVGNIKPKQPPLKEIKELTTEMVPSFLKELKNNYQEQNQIYPGDKEVLQLTLENGIKEITGRMNYLIAITQTLIEKEQK